MFRNVLMFLFKSSTYLVMFAVNQKLQESPFSWHKTSNRIIVI